MRDFNVVFTFDKGCGDFIIEGIFTKRADAVELAHKINPAFVDDGSAGGPQESGLAVYIVEQTNHQIAEHMVSQRLGQLYMPLRTLAEERTHRVEKIPEDKTLYSQSIFPAAVAKV